MANKTTMKRRVGSPTILRKSHAHKSKKDYDRKKLKGDRYALGETNIRRHKVRL